MTASTGPIKYKKGKLYELFLNEVHIDPGKIRASMDPAAMAELVASVAKMGVVNPIIFRQDQAREKIVVAGGRRVEASRQAGRSTIPGIFIEGDYQVVALIENMLRQDLTPIEEAEGMQALIGKELYSQEDLGAIVGKARNTMCETLSLNRLPQEIRDDCRGDRTVAKRKLVAIARKRDAAEMTAAYQVYKARLQRVALRSHHKDPNDPGLAHAAVLKAARKIEELDTSAWSAEEQGNFAQALARLRSALAKFPPA